MNRPSEQHPANGSARTGDQARQSRRDNWETLRIPHPTLRTLAARVRPEPVLRAAAPVHGEPLTEPIDPGASQ